MQVKANGISIEVEDTGQDGRPVVLLLMGLGLQLTAWPPALVQALVDAGFRVVRLDNRDIGLSQKFAALGTPNLLWESFKRKLGLPVRARYTLQDMALDALGTLDALGIGRVHLVGLSMGGMIAQRLAITAPQRVVSLTSVMSSSGARGLPGPHPQVLRAIFSRPAGTSEAQIVEHTVRLFKAIGSPAFATDDGALREGITAAVRRSFNPAGTLRQMAAIGADTARAHELDRINVPTLVVHGKDDPLLPLECGQDTARRIPGANMVTIPGMGHDLPPGVVERILQPLLVHLKQVEMAR